METTTQFSNGNVAEIQLVYRTLVKPSQLPKVTCSKEAYQLFLSNWNPDHIELCESFKLILLNRRNRVLGLIDHSSGTGSSALFDIRHLFAAAIKANAHNIIIAHNHPSGDTTPSDNDRRATKMIADAGRLLEVRLFDHLIITPDSYYSFADQGLI